MVAPSLTVSLFDNRSDSEIREGRGHQDKVGHIMVSNGHGNVVSFCIRSAQQVDELIRALAFAKAYVESPLPSQLHEEGSDKLLVLEELRDPNRYYSIED